jgi:chemotaxis protein methyltransferase CheR
MNSSWPVELERLRALIGRELGWQIGDGKLAVLAELLSRRTEARGEQVSSYLDRLDLSPPPEELRAFALALTVNETYFFRNLEQFRALAEVALPDRAAVRAASRTLRLLSAGCASGEEAYTMAIVARDLLGSAADGGWQILIRAVDANPDVIARARRGRYTAWSLRETPPEIQQRWFRSEGNELVLADAIRTAVRFEERNLARQDADLWAPDVYDVIFCRNTMMYFTPAQTQALIDRITRALAPGGYLFLGHAETLRGLSHEFHLLHSHNAFYYQRRDLAREQRAEWAQGPRKLSGEADGWLRGAAASPAAALSALERDDWPEQIRRGAERVRLLSEQAAAPASRAPGGAVGTPPVELGGTLELLRRERFAEALVDLDRLSGGVSDDPDVLLLRAALLTHGGRIDEAEAACALLLERDELSAGAHYLLALCRERHGDPAGAVEHDQIAAYLDPAFAMPRLHLGLMARRSGDREQARRELGQAALLLQREESGRILLFGGGFTRETLVALCNSNFGAVGGTA